MSQSIFDIFLVIENGINRFDLQLLHEELKVRPRVECGVSDLHLT